MIMKMNTFRKLLLDCEGFVSFKSFYYDFEHS